MAPVSQKADRRPISFYLDDQVSGTTLHVPLVIRPEELTRNEPSLMTATQTFDGAWIDDFGPGIATIQISGHTGWNVGAGWEASFNALRNVAFRQWHESRAAAVKQGRQPDDVKLIFADALDSFVNVVAPTSFTLKRSRTRPLLMMYQISLTVMSDRLTATEQDRLRLGSNGAPSGDGLSTGIESLDASLRKIEAGAGRVRSFIDGAVAQPLKDFMTLSATAMGRALAVVNTVRSVGSAQAQQLIGIAGDIALVGRNLFHTYNAIASLPDAARWEVAQIASAYENAFCVLRNAFQRVQLYPDYSDVYGASSCSSTIGGSPLSPMGGVNTFEVLLPGVSPPPSVTAEARAAIARGKITDPVLTPMTASEIASGAAAIASGVSYDG